MIEINCHSSIKITKGKTIYIDPFKIEKESHDADIVFVFGGTNDFGHGDAAVGCMDDREPYTFYGALHTLFTKIITKYPTAKIVVATPLHRCDEEKFMIKGGVPKAVKLIDYVNIIREVAEYYALPVLDLYKNSGLQPIVPIIQEKYVPDGLHPNDAGHVILADKIVAFLKSNFIRHKSGTKVI